MAQRARSGLCGARRPPLSQTRKRAKRARRSSAFTSGSRRLWLESARWQGKGGRPAAEAAAHGSPVRILAADRTAQESRMSAADHLRALHLPVPVHADRLPGAGYQRPAAAGRVDVDGVFPVRESPANRSWGWPSEGENRVYQHFPRRRCRVMREYSECLRVPVAVSCEGPRPGERQLFRLSAVPTGGPSPDERAGCGRSAGWSRVCGTSLRSQLEEPVHLDDEATCGEARPAVQDIRLPVLRVDDE